MHHWMMMDCVMMHWWWSNEVGCVHCGRLGVSHMMPRLLKSVMRINGSGQRDVVA